ncbi:hypothetical protein ABK905_20550 [Acerihabitans sp. KWT182]|uniref:Uncharacterized protein n=1 Tax=Acerihabitans sp. KWT182 TaxID=3157919 RepID=A0AAU7Q8A5_9GAMM
MNSFQLNIIYDICNAKSLRESIAIYRVYYKYLLDYRFIFASDKGAATGHSINRNFSSGSAIRGLFKTGRVFILDPNIFEEIFIMGRNVTFPIDYSISLDTMALSYLKPFIEGNHTKLPADYKEIF